MNTRRSQPMVAAAIVLASVTGAACAPDNPAGPGSAVFVTTTVDATSVTGATTSTTGTTTASTVTATTAESIETVPGESVQPSETGESVETVPGGVVTVAAVGVSGFESPVDLAVRPGDRHWYVVQQGGDVVAYDPLDASRTVVLSLGDETEATGERGLLGLAFHPTEPTAFVNFTSADDDHPDTHLRRFDVSPDGTFVNGVDVLTVKQPFGNHKGGALAFGPDGYLYVALGDGGSANDPGRRASDPADWLGSILRLDVSVGTGGYAVPPDNPFVTGSWDGVVGAPEVWAWGLRNPWKFTFDAATGDLWIADVGQAQFEEIDMVGSADGFPAGRGANFGWSAYEGTARLNDDVADPGNLVAPVLTYPHGDEGCAISGAAVYRGSALPDLTGVFVYGDYCSDKVWAFDLADGTNEVVASGVGNITAVRIGPDQELYVLSKSGTIHRLEPAPQ